MKLKIDDLKNIFDDRLGDLDSTKISNIPHPYMLKDMEKATKRILCAINNGERILLVGDYDVDGISSTSIIVSFFNKYFPSVAFDWVIPDRKKHGYGISVSLIEEMLKNKEYDLIFTVDNGIAAIDAAKYCLKKGIDLIITDHHTVPEEIPEAYAIVNQKQQDCTFPFKEICGAEIAWYLIKSIANESSLKMDSPAEFLEFVGLAIVSDVMPLIGMNRALLQLSLNLMNKSSLSFFLIMKKYIHGEKYTSESIAFKVAPMLNAAGRLYHASISVDALLSKSVEEAYLNVEKLNNINEERKEIEAEIFKEADIQVNPNDKFILVHGKWNDGVVGIVASKLVEKYKKPCIVLSLHEDNIFKGSGRSLGNIDLISLLFKNKAYFLKVGGHKMAAGMSIELEKISELKEKLNKDVSKLYSEKDFFLVNENILGELDTTFIGENLVELIEFYQPYGEANPAPEFKNKFKIMDKKILSEKHLKLSLLDIDNGLIFDGINFNSRDEYFKVSIGDVIECVYTVNKNIFRNNITYQLMISSIKI